MKKTKISESSNPYAVIASMTGLRSTAVQSYLTDNNIEVEKLTQDLVNGVLKPIDLSTAISGNPNNRYSLEIIKKYNSSAGKPNAMENTTVSEVRKLLNRIIKEEIVKAVQKKKAIREAGESDWEVSKKGH